VADRVPFYDRDLSSFADDIITWQTRNGDGTWHAVLDCGMIRHLSDPDFSPHGYGSTREEAARKSAHAIRLDAKGIGKYAPHSVLVPGYDLSFRLMRHWDKKERFQRLGIDPNEMIHLARRTEDDLWKLGGRWPYTWESMRAFEFDFQLCLAEMTHTITEEGADPSEAKACTMDAARKALSDISFQAHATEETWRILEERIDAHLMALGIGMPQHAP